MKIKHVVIENFRTIKMLDFDCSGKVNVFIGDNGAGKSTVLEALLVLYSWLNAKLTSPKSRGRSIGKEDIRIGAGYCFLSISVEHKGKSAQWSLMRGINSDNSLEKQTNLRELESFVRHISVNDDDRCLLSMYGVNRNISSVIIDKRIYGKKAGKEEMINTSARTTWKPFFNWFYERENEENRMKARFSIQYHDESLDAIRECLSEVFPGYCNLRVEDRPTRLVIEKDGQEINFDRLSDGEKCYIALVLDIARRLSTQNDGQGPILDGEQIILIDELDLHLHPSWQLNLVSSLERKFPNCQFFVSSHSSLVLSSIGEEDKLVVLRDGEQVELSDIPYGDNGDYILKRFFGLRSVRNPMVQEDIDSISAELVKNHPDFNEVERKLDALSEKGVQFEESVKMRLQLAQKKKMSHEKD